MALDGAYDSKSSLNVHITAGFWRVNFLSVEQHGLGHYPPFGVFLYLTM